MAQNTNVDPSIMGPFQGTEQTPQQGAQGLSGLLEDPNVQRFLAELGANIDPQGAGGAIGKPTANLISRQQQAKALSSAQQSAAEERQSILDALAGGSNITGVEYNEDGSVKKISGAAGGMETPQQTQPQGSDLGNLNQDFDLDSFEAQLDNIIGG